jgi:hypothetical protein
MCGTFVDSIMNYLPKNLMELHQRPKQKQHTTTSELSTFDEPLFLTHCGC